MKKWIFIADAFETGEVILFPNIPFIGNHAQAEQEAAKRRDTWESQHKDFICTVKCIEKST